jgi:hypothetical protein
MYDAGARFSLEQQRLHMEAKPQPPAGRGQDPEGLAPQPFGGRLHRLRRLLMPRFDDPRAEESYRRFTGRGSEAVQRFFALAISAYAAALWAYHLASPPGLDRQARVAVVLMSTAVLVAWLVWIVFRFAPATAAARHSSALHACQSTFLIGISCWGLPLTARPTCSTFYNTYDANLQQTMVATLLHASGMSPSYHP